MGYEADSRRRERRALQVKAAGLDLRDLGDLAFALHVLLLLDSFGPLLMSYAASWSSKQQPRQQPAAARAALVTSSAINTAGLPASELQVDPAAFHDAVAVGIQAVLQQEGVDAGAAPAAAAAAGPPDALERPAAAVQSGAQSLAANAALLLPAMQLHEGASSRSHKLQLFLELLAAPAVSPSSTIAAAGQADTSSAPNSSSVQASTSHPAGAAAESLRVQLADAFELFAVFLQLALSPGEQPLRLAKLLRYAQEFLGQDPGLAAAAAAADGGAAAAPAAAVAGVSLGSAAPRQQQDEQHVVQQLRQALCKDAHGVEQLLYFLAAAHVQLQHHTPQQQQQQQQEGAAAEAGPAAAGPAEGLREAAKTLKAYFKSITLRSLSLGTQLPTSMARGLCAQVLTGLLAAEQQQVEAVQARVTSLLESAGLPELEALQAAAAAEAAPGVAGPPPTEQQQQQGDAVGIEQNPLSASAGTAQATDIVGIGPAAATPVATRQGSNAAAAAAVAVMSPPATGAEAAQAHPDGSMQLRGGRITRSTPPPTPAAAAGSATPSAVGDTPRQTAAAAAAGETPPAGAAAADDGGEAAGEAGGGVTPPLPPSGPAAAAAEGRRAPRAAALAGKDRIVQSLGISFTAAAGAGAAAAAAGSSKVSIVALASERTAVLQLLQQPLKSVQELLKGQYGQLAADRTQAQRYKSGLFELVWRLAKLCAASAGLSVGALTGSSSAPTAEKKADEMLRAALVNTAALLDGSVSEKLVADSKAAVQQLEEPATRAAAAAGG